MRVVASLYSQQGKKGPNQDAVLLCQGFGMEDGVLCGVFDGHGRIGHKVSKLVEDYLPSLLLSQLKALHLTLSTEDKISAKNSERSCSIAERCSDSPPLEMFSKWKVAYINAFEDMDQKLKLHTNLDCSCSGTTAVTIIKQGKDLIVANLGDSRAVLGTISDEGHLKAVQLTTDLKPSVPEEAERICKSNGRVFALREEPSVQRVWLPNDDFPGLALARAFGDFQLKNYGVISVPQVSYRRLTSRDQFLILATDGVWDVLRNEKACSIVWSTRSEKHASKALVEASVRAWKEKFPSSKVDDCSAVCIFLQERMVSNN